MWGYLYAFIGCYLSYCTYNIFFVEHESGKGTEAQQIRKLYKGIRQIKNSQKYASSYLLTLDSIKETAITIYKYKKKQLYTLIVSPRKLGEHYVTVPYYMNNTWYKAIIPRHIAKGNKLVKVVHPVIVSKGFAGKEIVETRDVTSEIRGYMGPNEDFHQQIVTPGLFNYDQLEFQMLTPLGIVTSNLFTRDQPISFKKYL